MDGIDRFIDLGNPVIGSPGHFGWWRLCHRRRSAHAMFVCLFVCDMAADSRNTATAAARCLWKASTVPTHSVLRAGCGSCCSRRDRDNPVKAIAKKRQRMDQMEGM